MIKDVHSNEADDRARYFIIKDDKELFLEC